MGMYDRDWYREEIKRRREPSFDQQRGKVVDNGSHEFVRKSHTQNRRKLGFIMVFVPWILLLLILVLIFNRHFDGLLGRLGNTWNALRTNAEHLRQRGRTSETGFVNPPFYSPAQPRRLLAPTSPDSIPNEPNYVNDRTRVPELILPMQSNGGFYAKGQINGRDVVFQIDTGASLVSIPDRIRWNLNLARGQNSRTTTASDVIGTYETMIKDLSIGPIRLQNIKGELNPRAQNDVILLGMSALKHLEIVHKNETLVLRAAGTSQTVETTESPNQRPEETLEIKRSVRECMGTSKVINERTLGCLKGN